jgi:amino acid transporter
MNSPAEVNSEVPVALAEQISIIAPRHGRSGAQRAEVRMTITRLKTLPWWMAALVGAYLFFSVLAMYAAPRELGLLFLPGFLAMLLGATFLEPIGLAHSANFFPNPNILGWLILLVAYSGLAYMLGWLVRMLANRRSIRD